MSPLLIGVVVVAVVVVAVRLLARSASRQRAARSHHRALGTLGELTSRPGQTRPAVSDHPFPSTEHVRLVRADQAPPPTSPAPAFAHRPLVAPSLAASPLAPLYPPEPSLPAAAPAP
ncbi:MAG: hypothetical protein ACYC1D_17670, partial [Acidimicrobiales bacterium]